MLKAITQKIHIRQGKEKQQEDSDEMNSSEKHVSLNLYIENSKSSPSDAISNQYNNKGKFGF